MTRNSQTKRVYLAGFLAVAAATPASAVTLTPGKLTPVAVNGYVGLGAAGNYVSISGAGMAALAPSLPCSEFSNSCLPGQTVSWGPGSVSATLGSDPGLDVKADNNNDALFIGGGVGEVTLSYSFAYANNNAPPGTTFVADLRSSDDLFVSGDAIASASLKLQGDGASFAERECLTVTGTNGCAGPLHTGAPFVANTLLILRENTTYEVDLEVDVTAYFTRDIYDPTAPTFPGIATASIDPRITTTASDGGQLIFSPGVTSGAPEPATWALMLLGFGSTGLVLRRGRQNLTTADAALSRK
jgi:hypothetical protein